jgi:hypothetical protein
LIQLDLAHSAGVLFGALHQAAARSAAAPYARIDRPLAHHRRHRSDNRVTAGVGRSPSGGLTAYVNDAMPVQTKVFLRDYENFMTHMPTAFMNARVAGASRWLAAGCRP